jgi:hypothetical protein
MATDGVHVRCERDESRGRSSIMASFHGASNSFENAHVNRVFPLTGSFRFGEGIARLANLVLEQSSQSFQIKGLSANKGDIWMEPDFSKVVVICRSNTGMLKFLIHYFVLSSNGATAAATQKRWAFYGKSVKLPAISQKLLQLETFVQGTFAIQARRRRVFNSCRLARIH